MRVAIVTESFLPHVNGVTGSVLRVLEHLQRHRHPALVVSPCEGAPAQVSGASVAVVPSLRLPGYADVRVSTVSTRRVTALLQDFGPDVVHLASPFLVGMPAMRAARRLGVPAVAVYQTDVAGFATQYRLALAGGAAWRRIRRIHELAERTLAPSRSAAEDLRRHGVPRVSTWARGVDAVRWSPAHRDAALRRRLAPDGHILVGYVGRLASEKRVEDLAALSGLPGVRLVIVGDGPQAERLARRLPDATFLGLLGGDPLSAVVASLDVFVHPGQHETFCQAAQEALASGVPVVAVASGALPELVAAGRTGSLYPAGDLAGLRRCVADLAADPERRAAMGEAARASVASRTWERMCDELLDHYGAAAGSSQLQPSA